jgi:hypothetical protein
VKWGTLVHLAKEHGISTIVQIAFYRPENGNLTLDSDKGPVPFPSVVLDYFRRLERIAGLEASSGLNIRVLSEPFQRNGTTVAAARKAYIERVAADFRGTKERLIALLDPDTGIAPDNHDFRHVLPSEIRELYEGIRTGSWMVLYQHARRNKDWLKTCAKQFADAVGVSSTKVHTYGADLAKDVALFAVGRD